MAYSRTHFVLLTALLVAAGAVAGARSAAVLAAQAPSVGRTPPAEDLNAIDIAIMPDGRGLPTGSGTAQAGRSIYDAKCASCHGPSGKEGPNDVLVGGVGTLTSSRPL